MNDWARVMLTAGLEAGKEVMDIYESGNVGVEYKEDSSPLTRADRASHQIIMHHLETTGIPVLSEEGRQMPFESRSSWKELWIVDPIDGTKEFIKRNGEFTVNIALIRNGCVAGGVVLAPALGYAYVGIRGEGAWRLDVNVSESTEVDFAWRGRTALPLDVGERPFTVVASRSHMSEETQAYVNQVRAVHGEVNLISKGSSLKLCMVAEGTADAYPRFAPTMEWDTAAGQAVCEAAGCEVIDQNTGKPMLYNRKELLNGWFLVSRTH